MIEMGCGWISGVGGARLECTSLLNNPLHCSFQLSHLRGFEWVHYVVK